MREYQLSSIVRESIIYSERLGRKVDRKTEHCKPEEDKPGECQCTQTTRLRLSNEDNNRN